MSNRAAYNLWYSCRLSGIAVRGQQEYLHIYSLLLVPVVPFVAECYVLQQVFEKVSYEHDSTTFNPLRQARMLQYTSQTDRQTDDNIMPTAVWLAEKCRIKQSVQTSSLRSMRPSRGRDIDHWLRQSSNMIILRTVDSI